MARKTGGMKTPVVRDKAIQRGQVEIGIVRNGFQNAELDSPCLRSLRHRRRFHVHRDRAVGSGESSLLFFARHSRGTHQDSVA
jgi:hypothetical protein